MAGTSEAAGERAVVGRGIAPRALDAFAGRAMEWAAAWPWALPTFAATLGIAARVWLVARANGMIDADEAMVGIQAERILRGQYPTYFYGQVYMGSLEAYLVAPFVALLGPTGWALRLVPIILSPLLVYLTWRLARALLRAHAPSTPLLAGLAALVAAVPPLYDVVAELRAWGGQVEIYVITLALLVCVVELADRLRAGAGAGELTRRWLALGFVAGLGIWINPLISYALIAAALWLLPPLCLRGAPGLARWLARLARRAEPDVSGGWSAPALVPTLAALPGVAVGGLPAWLYAARHGGENLLVYVSQPAVDPNISHIARYGRLAVNAVITFRYATCVAPAVLDGGMPAESRALLPLRLLLLVPPVMGLICGIWLTRGRSSRVVRTGLPLVYAGAVTAVFCLGTSAWALTISRNCQLDLAGRYAIPLVLVEPFFLLAMFALPSLIAGWRAGRARTTTGHPDAEASGGRGGLSGVILLAVLVAGLLQGATYVAASPSRTFQSPYYDRVPTDQTQLLSYLSAHGIRAAWCNHWIGNVITYRTDGATVCADYYDQVYKGGIVRPPGTLDVVSAAERPSFILILTDPRPCLARELDAAGVSYTLDVLPASGVTVITPDRTVNPATVIAGLGQDYSLDNLHARDCSNAPIAALPTSTRSSSSNSRLSPGSMNSSRPF